MSKRFTVDTVLNSRFYQLPKFLFEGIYKRLSSDARILYSLLKDRHELSIRKRWVNSKGEVYIIYTREDLADVLGCSQPTLRKAIKALKDFKLIEEERPGLGAANRIYVLQVESENSPTGERSVKALPSGLSAPCSQKEKSLAPSDTYYKDTYTSDTPPPQAESSDTVGQGVAGVGVSKKIEITTESPPSTSTQSSTYREVSEVIEQIKEVTGEQEVRFSGIRPVLALPDGIQRLRSAIQHYPEITKVTTPLSPVGFLIYIAKNRVTPSVSPSASVRPSASTPVKKVDFSRYEQHSYSSAELDSLFERIG